jgi:hypothetical protein
MLLKDSRVVYQEKYTWQGWNKECLSGNSQSNGHSWRRWISTFQL